jgi:hypothetical protein
MYSVLGLVGAGIGAGLRRLQRRWQRSRAD